MRPKITIRPGENFFRVIGRRVIGTFRTECELNAAVREYRRRQRKKQNKRSK